MRQRVHDPVRRALGDAQPPGQVADPELRLAPAELAQQPGRGGHAGQHLRAAVGPGRRSPRPPAVRHGRDPPARAARTAASSARRTAASSRPAGRRRDAGIAAGQLARQQPDAVVQPEPLRHAELVHQLLAAAQQRAQGLPVPDPGAVLAGQPRAGVLGVVRRQPAARRHRQVIEHRADAQAAPHRGRVRRVRLGEHAQLGQHHRVVEAHRPGQLVQRVGLLHLLAARRAAARPRSRSRAGGAPRPRPPSPAGRPAAAARHARPAAAAVPRPGRPGAAPGRSPAAARGRPRPGRCSRCAAARRRGRDRGVVPPGRQGHVPTVRPVSRMEVHGTFMRDTRFTFPAGSRHGGGHAGPATRGEELSPWVCCACLTSTSPSPILIWLSPTTPR